MTDKHDESMDIVSLLTLWLKLDRISNKIEKEMQVRTITRLIEIVLLGIEGCEDKLTKACSDPRNEVLITCSNDVRTICSNPSEACRMIEECSRRLLKYISLELW